MIIHAPDAIKDGVDLLNEYFDERKTKGVVFKKGETVQVGWMYFRVAESGDGLKLQAPLSGKMPFHFQDDCSIGINAVMSNKYMPESFGCRLSGSNCCQFARILKGLNEKSGVFMNRLSEEKGNDSGWFVGGQNSNLDPNDPSNMEFKSLWEISCIFPVTLSFWSFEPNWQILIDVPPTVLNNFNQVQPTKGSFFTALYG